MSVAASAGRPLRRGRLGAGQPAPSGRRDTEWLSALLMGAWALALAVPGDGVAGPSLAAAARLGLTGTAWTCAFGAAGVLRLVALGLDGRSPLAPYARMLGAFLGFLGWGQVSLITYHGGLAMLGVVVPGVAVYGVLSAMDLRSLYRASFDARYDGG